MVALIYGMLQMVKRKRRKYLEENTFAEYLHRIKICTKSINEYQQEIENFNRKKSSLKESIIDVEASKCQTVC